MKSKHSRLERKYKHYHIPAGDWQLSQDEAKELERRQQVLLGLSELNQSDPGGARAIPDIVFHNISSSRQRQLAEEHPARDSQGASVGHLDYVGAIKEGLNDEEFATLENSFHAYISLPAELQQKWQSDLRASKPDSDEYKSRKEYERASTAWPAEGLCSLKKLAEEAQATGHQHSESKPKSEVIPEPKQQGVEAQPQPIVGPETNPEPKSKGEFQSQPQQQKPVIQEKAEDKPNPTDEKNWDNIENRRAVVRRLTMLGDAESAVVEEAMAKSVYREYSLASLAFFESDGKASPSLAKRQHELYDDLKLARDKFSDSDTSTIFKVVSNFSNEQMDDLDKLVDEVAILAEKDPQGMERLRSNVRERSHELADEVHETALSDSLSSKEYHKREADLVGNFYSRIIAQTREAAEAVTKSRGEGQGQGSEQASATSQPEPAPQPRPEVNPSSGQEPEKEQPESPTGGEGKGEERHSAEGEKQPPTELAGAPNPAGEKNWDNIENRRAVVRRMTMLGDDESDVVQEAMLESVDRERFLAHLALLEPKGKARASLEKRLYELDDDLERTLNIEGKFSDSDTNSIFKVISNFSYEQMDDLDKLVDGVAILAEKDPQGMERLRSDVTQRRHELSKKVEEIRLSDFVSNKEYCKLTADLVGNSHSRIIAQTREAAEAVTGKSKPKQSSATSQPGSTSQPSSEANPQSKQKPKQEQPKPPAGSGGEGKGQSGITGEKEPEDDRQRLAGRLVDLGKEGRYSSADLVRIAIMTRLSVSEEDQLYGGKSGFGYQKVSIVKDDTDSESGVRYKVIPGDEKISDRVFSSEKGYSDELINLGLKITDDLDKIPQKEGESIAKAMLQYCPYRKKGQSVEDYDRERERWSTWAINDINKRAKEIESGKREEEISPEGMASFREYVSGYIQEKILPKTPNSELLIHGFFYSLGAKRLEELMRKHSSVSGNSFDTMVRAIKDYDGLDSRECYKLKDFVDDLDTLRGGVDSQEGNELKQDDEVEQRRNAEAMKVIQSDVFAEGMRKIGELQGANASPDEIDRAMVDFGGEIQGLVHQRASRVELLNKYQRSSEDARRIANNLTFNELVGHYDEETHRWQPDIDNALTGKLNEERIDLLTDDEVKSYRKNLTLVNSLSKFSMGKLVEFDKKLADLKGGVVPPEVKETLQRYRPLLTAPNKDAAFYREPDTPEEVQAINQARTTIYQMELDKVNELAENDKKMGDRLKLCDTYRKSTAAVREAVNCLVNRDKFDRYDEDTGMERGEELENKVDKKPGETLYDALMRMENVSLLTDDEIESYRRHLEATKELSKDSLDRLIEISNNPESFDDSLVPPDVKEALKDYEDIEPETDEEIQAYNQAQAKLHQIMMNQIGELMKVDARVEKTRGLRGEYYRSDGDVQDVVDLLAERKIFDRYNESNGKYRGEELGENEQGETLSDALMRKDNICFLTDDEVDIYCKHFDLVRNLSANHLKELMDLDDSLLDDPDNDVVPPDVKDVLAKYKDAAPDTPEEIQAYNQAQEKLYQILLERADSMRASEEADQARGVELKQKLFNKDVNPQIRRLVIGELMMKSMSKERYEEFAEAFGVGESEYGEPQFNIIKFMLRQSVSKANPDKTDDRGMSLEEYNYASEMLELASQLSDSQLKQLVESDEADKTRISNGRRDSKEFWESRQQYSKDLEQKIRQMVETEENDPMLSMVGVDRSRIVEMKAYIDAKRKLDEEMTFKPENFAAKDLNAEGKPKLLARLRHAVVARFWKGKVMRNYYEYKYRKELKEQYSKDFTHTLGAETDGSSMSSAETEQALIWRMTQDSDFFTKTLGEKREQLSPDSEAYKRMYQAVKTFVENGDEAAFTEESRRINHDLMGGEGAPVLDNYLTSAIYIKGLVDHDRSFDDVMKGFKMYRGVSAEGVNSGHHERAIDKLVAKFERRNADNKLSWIPPEWVAGAAGIAGWLGGAIARNRVVQAFSFGGSAALAGAMAGAKESERVKIDRADLARRLAEGGKVDEDNDYETKLAETLPEMRTAESYMNAIDLAIASGDIDQIRQALADVVVAREVGRNEGIDLIDYYSGGGDAEATKNELMSRQFDLEVAYINANSDPDLTLQKFKSRLIDGLNVASHAYSARFRTVEGDLFNQSNLSEDVQKQINEVYAAQEARDKIADRFRRKRMGAEFAKTAARTLAVSIGAQEIAAFFRSDLQGALEHAFGHDDAPGTTRTLLGGLLPTPNGNAVNEVVTGGARPERQFYREDEINHEQIKQWQAEGYKVDKHFDYEPHGGQGTVSAEEAVRDNVTVHRSGWADNLTERIDGNELAGHHTDIATQYAFQPSHGATGMGFTISRSEIFDAGQDGQVELWLSPTRGTQANPFKIIGHVVDNQIVFDAEPGSEAAEMLANKSYAFAEVVHAKSGFVMSTEVGSGTATSFAHQAVEYVREQTGWDVIPPVDQIVSPAPVGTPDVEIPVPVPPIFRQAHDARQGLSTNEELRQVDATETESGTGHKLRDLLSREQMKARADRQWLKQRLDYLQQNDKYGAGLLESVMVNSLPGELIEQLPGASQKISFRPSKTEGNPAKVIPGEIVVPTEDAILSNEGYPPETIAMGLSIARSLRKLNKFSDDDREGKLKQILRDQPRKGEWLPGVEDNSHESNEDFEKRRMKWAADATDKIASLASPKGQHKHNFWKKYHELKHEMQIAMTGPGYDERVLGNRLSVYAFNSMVSQALLAYYRDLGEDEEPDLNDFVDKFNDGDYTDGELPEYFDEVRPFYNALIHKRWQNGEEPTLFDLFISTPPPSGWL